MKFYPYKKKGGGGVLAILKEGSTTHFEVVLTWELGVSYSDGGGGAKGFHPLKGGRKTFYPVLRGVCAKSFEPQFFYCVAHLPIINDQSLKR